MNDWLSKIEEDYREGIYPTSGTIRMARVIREQSVVLKDGPWYFVGGGVVGGGYKCRHCQAFLKVYLSPDGIGPLDFIERHKKDCVWRNLSPDAKELLTTSVASNDEAEE